MEEIVKQVAERTGISQDQARQAVQMVVSTIKERLPPQFAGQIDAIVSGPGSGDAASQALGALGGMFGKKE